MSLRASTPALRGIQAQALREAAEEIVRELVCCDAFEQRDPKHRHKICYWGGAAAKLVADRADRIENRND